MCGLAACCSLSCEVEDLQPIHHGLEAACASVRCLLSPAYGKEGEEGPEEQRLCLSPPTPVLVEFRCPLGWSGVGPAVALTGEVSTKHEGVLA